MNVDKVFCINLDRRNDRWETVKPKIDNNMPKNMPHVEKFSATDGHLLDDCEKQKLLTLRAKVDMIEPRHTHESIGTVGAIGCYLSHTAIWKMMVEQGWEKIIVFEDDIEFVSDFSDKFNKVLSEINDNFDKSHTFDMLVFGYYTIINMFDEYSESLYKCNGRYWGNYGYILTQAGAKKMLEGAFPLEMHLDSYIAFKCMVDPTLNVLFTKENIVYMNDIGYKSDIYSSCVNGWLPDKILQREPINHCKLPFWLRIKFFVQNQIETGWLRYLRKF